MSDDEFRQMLAAVSAEFKAGLPARIAAIDDLWGRVLGGASPAGSLAELIRELHSLAGSAATFGQAEVGAAAAAAESRLEPSREAGQVPDEASRVAVSRLLEALRTAAAARPD